MEENEKKKSDQQPEIQNSYNTETNKENESPKEAKQDKKNKRYLKVHWAVITACILGIIIQVFSIIYSYCSEISTLSIFGNKYYISTYDDEDVGIKLGDLIIGKGFKDGDGYYNYESTIFKTDYKKRKSIIVKDTLYYVIETAKENVESRIVSVYRHIGNFILLLRQIFAIIIFTIMLIAIFLATILLRGKDIPKKYLRIRRIKDTCIILFVITTYISTFFIGKIVGYDDIYDELDNNNIPVNKEINFDITEDGVSWNQIQNLNVFDNEYFRRKNKVAPGFSGIYEFKVNNKDKSNLFYDIKFEETNLSKINLMYKIIRNGKYLNEEYKPIEELNIKDAYIIAEDTDVYQIDWMWIDADNDTEIGRNARNVKYKREITILAQRAY